MGLLHRTIKLRDGELIRLSRLHRDFFGEEWRRCRAPHRLYVHLPRGTLTVALTPGGRVADGRRGRGRWVAWHAATLDEG